MPRRKQPDSPLMQTLVELLEITITWREPLLHPVGARLWRDAQAMVAEAGGVPHIPIEAASFYCLIFRHNFAFREGDFSEALAAVHDYWSHPQAEQDMDNRHRALYLAGTTLLELQRPNEALEMVSQLLSEKFDNRKERTSALLSVRDIFRCLLSPDWKTPREGVPPPGWAEAIERWAKRWKRSKTAQRWLSENPTNEELWNLMQRV